MSRARHRTNTRPPDATSPAIDRIAAWRGSGGSACSVNASKIRSNAAVPGRRRLQDVGDDVVDAGSREPAPRGLDRGRRDVEGGDVEAGGGERLGVVAEAAPDHQAALADRRRAERPQPRDEKRVRPAVGPGHLVPVAPGLPVEALEPAGRVALRDRLGRDAAHLVARCHGVSGVSRR